MGFESGTPGLVKDLLNRAEFLMGNSICVLYSKRLEKVQRVFVNFAHWVGLHPYPASNELLAAFLAWLELSKRVAEMPTCLTAIARGHKVRGLVDSTKGSQIRLIVEEST
ncbi:24727_t:CDS:2 [Dentiscutata erythropus]|uniref:24727_t:CDS:1 n=1 Tax=Dentiscutata erythropus TaxID=1348616 RepID=A0A9N9HSV3_9GLOM|nr:24727_t:CDS:2 [Dentiscutata erythropus]